MNGAGESNPPPTGGGARAVDYRSVALQAALVWLATRLVYALFTYIGFIFASQGFDPDKMGLGPSFFPSTLLKAWDRWDTGWYLAISTHGYAPDIKRSVFFPLFPGLTAGMREVLGLGDESSLAVGLAVSNLGSLAAFVGIGLLAARELGERVAPYALAAFAAYPFSFFTAAAYADGLFVGLSAFSLLLAREGRWGGAAACAFAAALTRPTGVALALPLIWEYAQKAGWLSREGPRSFELRVLARGLPVALAVPLAIGLYSLYLWAQFGRPFTFLEMQSSWGHIFVPPWDLPALALNSVTGQLQWSFNQARVLVDIMPALLFVALGVLSIKRLPGSFTLMLWGALALALASPLVGFFHPFASVGRYMLAAFPAFLLLGLWCSRRPWLQMLVVGGGFMLQAVFLTFFLMGGWMI